MTELNAHMKIEVSIAHIWAEPRPGLTIDELVTRLQDLGHTVLQVDYDGTISPHGQPGVLIAHKSE